MVTKARCLRELVSFEELDELTGFRTTREMEQRYLTVTQREAKYGATR
jgi:hypothetical protein